MTDNQEMVSYRSGGREMVEQRPNNATIDDARLLFRNFGGAADKYNAAGIRSFHVVLSQEGAEAMQADGFNVKFPPPREDGQQRDPHVKVNVNMESGRPPKIYVVTSKGKTLLEKDMLNMLDWAVFARVDLIINRYERDWGDGRKTVTAYLQTMFAFILEDELELRYAELADADEQIPQGAADTMVWQISSPTDIEAIKQHELEQ